MQKIHWNITRFPKYDVSTNAVIRRNATPAYKESPVLGSSHSAAICARKRTRQTISCFRRGRRGVSAHCKSQEHCSIIRHQEYEFQKQAIHFRTAYMFLRVVLPLEDKRGKALFVILE
jgi:hypothetical protein